MKVAMNLRLPLSLLPTPILFSLSIPFSLPQAAPYFAKVECFCFESQRLLAHEQVDLPVFFFIDSDILDDPACRDVQDVVLSYTFFAARRNERSGQLEWVPFFFSFQYLVLESEPLFEGCFEKRELGLGSEGRRQNTLEVSFWLFLLLDLLDFSLLDRIQILVNIKLEWTFRESNKSHLNSSIFLLYFQNQHHSTSQHSVSQSLFISTCIIFFLSPSLLTSIFRKSVQMKR